MLKNHLKYLLVIITIASFFLYLPVNRVVSGGYNLETPLDILIPLLPIFAIPYLLSWVFWLGTIFYVNIWQKRSTAINFDIKLIAAGVFSSIIYLIVPTFASRAVVAGSDVFSNLVRMIYDNDRSYSAAPSGHTFYTVLCLIALNKLAPKYKILWFVITAVIILSTFFIKQHNILDALLGIVFALAISYFTDKIKTGD